MKTLRIVSFLAVVVCLVVLAISLILLEKPVHTSFSSRDYFRSTPKGWSSRLVYELSVESPKSLPLNSDGEVIVSLKKVRILDPPDIIDAYNLKVKGGYIELELQSESLKITPSKRVRLSIKPDAKRSFLITPVSEGLRKLLLLSRLGEVEPYVKKGPYLDKDWEQTILPITVTSPPSMFGLSQQTVKNMQTVATIIGLPGLLVLVVSLLLERKKRGGLVPEESGAEKSTESKMRP